MRSPRLVAAQPRFQFVDTGQQLAREHGAGAVEGKVATQPRGARHPCGGVGCVAAIEQPEGQEAAGQLGRGAGAGGEQGGVDGRRGQREERGRPQGALRGSKFEVFASCSKSSRSLLESFFGTMICTSAYRWPPSPSPRSRSRRPELDPGGTFSFAVPRRVCSSTVVPSAASHGASLTSV